MIRKKTCHILFFLFLFYSSLAFAQETLKGVVMSAADGMVIPGATILIEGKGTGTVTDLDGNFVISASLGDRLRFSFIGMQDQRLVLESYDNLLIKLNSTAEVMEELVVVGYGVQKKESVVGAVTQIASEDLMNSGVNNVTQSLTGKLSGVVTTQNNGRPGEDDANITIRGKSSWVSSSPLVMVDGIERSFNDIDPNEIETISVLKDASATAVYGTRGANGVILVTTKRGMDSKPKISVSFTQGIKNATSVPEYVDAYTTLKLANIAKKNDGNFTGLISEEEMLHYKNGTDPYIYPDVDWINEMIKTGYSTSANVNLRGGTKFVKYFASIGYNHDGDILNSNVIGDLDPRFYSDRYNLRSNFDFDLTKTSRIKVNIGGSSKVKNGNSGYYSDFFKNIYQLGVNASPLYYGADALEQYPDINEPGATGWRFAKAVGEGENPYTILHAGKSLFDYEVHYMKNTRTITTDLSTDIGFDQDLSAFVNGLSASALVSMNTTVAYERLEQQDGASYILNENGTWRRSPNYDYDLEPLSYTNHSLTNNTRKFYWEAKINYVHTFDKHYVTAMGIFNRSRRDVSSSSSDIEPVYLQEAWSARATYAYDLKYMFEVNLGYSGSEQFAVGNRFGFFPAFALGWNAGEEEFIKDNLSFMNKLKFRYSYGKTGSDKSPGSERWLYESEGYESLWIGNSLALFGSSYGQQGVYTYAEGKLANVNAQWEEAIKQNFGIETAFFGNKLSFAVDFFKEDRDNILMEPATIPTYAQVDFKALNLGQTKNHGFEMELGYTNETSFGLGYFTSANFSFNENRVVYKDDPESLPDYQKSAGFPIGTQTLYLQDELYQTVDDVANYLSKSPGVMQGDVRFVDYNADGVIDDNDKVAYEGTNYPLYSFGFSFGADYRGFSLNAMIQGMQDKYSYFSGISSDPFFGANNRINGYQVDNYWTVDNTNAFYPTTHYDASLKAANNDYSYSQRYLNTSFIRLKELQIAYTFNPKWNKFPMDYLMVYVSGNNLLTFSEYSEMGDPEKTEFNPSNKNNAYPLLRRYNIGFKFNF